MGMWDEMFDAGMEKHEFREQIIYWLETVDMDWMLEAEFEGKIRPMGLVLAWLSPGGRIIEPHVNWFPWASTRVKFECAATFFSEVRREYKVFVYSGANDEAFFARLHKHRLLNRGCKIPDYFAPGDHAWFYYTNGPSV